MASPLFASSTTYSSFEISNPKIVFLNGAEVGAAYLTIVQTSSTSDRLLSAKIKNDSRQENKSFLERLTSLFSKSRDKQPTIELHDHIPSTKNKDVMTMRAIKDGIEIPAASKDADNKAIPGKPVKFETGGKHLMLYHFPEIIRKSEKTDIILTFEKAGDVSISFPINPASSEKEKPCPCHGESSS